MIDLLEDFGGFGLVLVGLWLLFTQVRPLVGSGLRDLLGVARGRGLGARALGLLAGALVQSPSAVASASASLLAVGRVDTAAALRVFVWAHPGSALLVLLAASDPRALVFLVVGALGASFLLGVDKREIPRHVLTALLGLAVMLLGASTLEHDVGGVPAVPAVIGATAFLGAYPAVGFVAGLALSTVLRSMQVVVLLTFPLVQADLVGFEGVAPVIYGASLRWVIGTHSIASLTDRASRLLERTGRWIRLGAIAILCLLYVLETMAGIPVVMAAVRAISDEAIMQVALLCVTAQLAIAAVGEILGGTLLRAASSRAQAPAAPGVHTGEAVYLHATAHEDPVGALTAAEAEFERLVRALPAYLDEVRDEGGQAGGSVPLAAHHRGCAAIASRLDDFLSGTLEANPDTAGMERLFRLRARVVALQRVQSTLHAFVGVLASVPKAARPSQADAMCEGLHAVLQVAVDTLGPIDGSDAADTLRALTGDRGALMDSVRDAILQGLAQGSPAQREAMLDATLHFEKCLWALPRVADV